MGKSKKFTVSQRLILGFSILILLPIFLISPPGLIYAQETIKSASEYDYPPFSIVTEKGEADGFSVELLRASLKAIGLDVEFYVGPWAKIKHDLAQGKIQVLPLVGRTPEREKNYDFSVPYKTMYGGIFVRTGETRINTLKDLADKEILVMKGDKELLARLNDGLSKIISNGTFDIIHDKWFGIFITGKETLLEKKVSLSIIQMVWIMGILIALILFLLILNKLNIVKFEKTAIMLLLSIALLLIIGLFIFNAYNITNNLKESAIKNYFDTLRATASNKHMNIKQHITHVKSAFKILSSRKTFSNKDLKEIVKLGEDFSEIFITDSNGKITHSSDISHIGISRLADPYFKNAKKGIFLKQLYLSETIGEVSFTISTLYNKGVLVARMHLNHIHEIISNKEGLGQSGESLLAYRNENGDAVFFTKRRFTAEAEARDIIPKKDVNIPITQALLKNEKEFSNYVDYRGVPVFAVTKYIDEIDAGLVVKIDQEEALRLVSGNINQIWYSTTAIILAIIIVGIIFYFLLTYSLRREVKIKTNELEKTSKRLSEQVVLLQNSERKLIESEEKVRNIFDNSTLVHYSHGVDHVTTYISPQIEHILGYTPEEADDNWKDLLSDNPINAIAFKNTTKAIQTGERQSAYELELLHKNGKKVFVEIHEAPVVKNGKTISIIGSFADITDRKLVEEEKIQLEEQYRQAQKMESVGRLAGGVAHDFNNALSVIRGFTEFALEDADPKGQLHEDLNEVLTAAKRATDTTRQLLAFARKQIIAPKVLDLNEIVESMLKMLRRLIGEDIDLSWLPGANLWSVKIDPSQIDQILANLCVNARDAIENVGKVTIETNTVIFDSAYCAEHNGFIPGEFVLLAVSDNGCGMDKEVLDNIFEPFFTTKPVDKGTGLGLATVYGIIKQNNGFINVYSEPGKGTTIKIYFSRHEALEVESQEESTTDIPIGSGETILIVEDDLSILKLVGKTLKGLGYTVLTAGTPGEAMNLAKEYPSKIHLVVTDVIMPEMNGRELSEQLQSQYPDLKCIFMSGYTANAIAHHGVLDEGMEFLQKPFSKTDLAKIVRKTLDG